MAAVLVKYLLLFSLLLAVISSAIRIGLSLVLPQHWAILGQLVGTLAFGIGINLSPLRFRSPTVKDKE